MVVGISGSLTAEGSVGDTRRGQEGRGADRLAWAWAAVAKGNNRTRAAGAGSSLGMGKVLVEPADGANRSLDVINLSYFYNYKLKQCQCLKKRCKPFSSYYRPSQQPYSLLPLS